MACLPSVDRSLCATGKHGEPHSESLVSTKYTDVNHESKKRKTERELGNNQLDTGNYRLSVRVNKLCKSRVFAEEITAFIQGGQIVCNSELHVGHSFYSLTFLERK